jgi:hypothetical protein
LAVIAFVIVTSIVNIGLGYALAVYLRKETASAGPTPTPNETMMSADVAAVLARASAAVDASVHLQSQPSALSWQSNDAAAVLAARAAALSPGQPPADSAGLKFAADAPQGDEQHVVRTAEMDQDLLAGIEEFRNQLAQLKGQSLDGASNPLAAGAAL